MLYIKGMDEEQESRFAVRDLFEWKSLNRPVWSFSNEAFRTVGAIALLVSIILLFFQEWFAIFVTWAAFFLFYALTKVPPVEVDHKITTQGIISMGRNYLWSELGPFWFSEKSGETILHVAHKSMFGQLIIIVHKEDLNPIRDILAEFLPYIEAVEKSPAERMQNWFSNKFPLDKVMRKDFSAKEEPVPPVPSAGVEPTSQPSEGHTLSS